MALANALIVSRTRWGRGFVCVGAVDVQSGETFRLKTLQEGKTPDTVEYQVGEEWELDFHRLPPHAPFCDDIAVRKSRRTAADGGLVARIESLCDPVAGTFDDLFEGRLVRAPGGKRFIPASKEQPKFHTQFWRPSTDLRHRPSTYDGTTKHDFADAGRNAVKYVGAYESSLPDAIAAGALVRVSLGEQFATPESDNKPAYWLQLSHIYE